MMMVAYKEGSRELDELGAQAAQHAAPDAQHRLLGGALAPPSRLLDALQRRAEELHRQQRAVPATRRLVMKHGWEAGHAAKHVERRRLAVVDVRVRAGGGANRRHFVAVV